MWSLMCEYCSHFLTAPCRVGLKAYFPPLHPRLGLHHMRLGQACMRCGDLASACKHIGAADVILSVSHGPSSEIVQAVKELRTLLQRA